MTQFLKTPEVLEMILNSGLPVVLLMVVLYYTYISWRSDSKKKDKEIIRLNEKINHKDELIQDYATKLEEIYSSNNSNISSLKRELDSLDGKLNSLSEEVSHKVISTISEMREGKV